MPDQDLSQLKIDKTASIYRPVKRKKYLYWGIVTAAAIALIVLSLQGVFSPAIKVEAAHVSQMYPSQGFTLLNASGYVVAQRKAAVASKVTGRLISLSVEEGSRVTAGQVIALLENEDVLAARNQAEANLNASRQNLEQMKAELHDATLSFNRNKDLIGQGFVSQSEYDASEARYKKASASVGAAEAAVKASTAVLRGAEVAVEYTLIRAPFNAVVLTKDADIGDIVTPIGAAAEAKAAVVTIADMDSLQVEVDVSESNLQMVKSGQPCEIHLDALPDSRFRGKVHMIVPTADRTKATIMVKVRFLEKDSRVLPEMSAKVAFLSREVKPDEEKPRTALNPSAILTRDGRSIVFLIKEDRVIKTPITTGEKLGEMIEVLQGVKAGDTVVIKPPERMKDRAKIKIVEK
ncbi:MAG: efflux pump, family, rane fusion protein [Nitrospirae bacterium]|nr:efflux pump, family, rane fusion protein [Nitrospirota bacterium]